MARIDCIPQGIVLKGFGDKESVCHQDRGRSAVKEVCSDDGDSFSRLIIIFLVEVVLLVFAQNLLVFK